MGHRVGQCRCDATTTSTRLARISTTGLGELHWSREYASSLAIGAKLWSAAACCRFPPRELARGDFDLAQTSPPASWLAKKPQQAAALQSSARANGLFGARDTVIIRNAL